MKEALCGTADIGVYTRVKMAPQKTHNSLRTEITVIRTVFCVKFRASEARGLGSRGPGLGRSTLRDPWRRGSNGAGCVLPLY